MRRLVFTGPIVFRALYPMPVHVITLNLLMTISLDPYILLPTGYLSSTTNLKLNL